MCMRAMKFNSSTMAPGDRIVPLAHSSWQLLRAGLKEAHHKHWTTRLSRFPSHNLNIPPTVSTPVPLGSGNGIDEPTLDAQQSDDIVWNNGTYVEQPQHRDYVRREVCLANLLETDIFHQGPQTVRGKRCVGRHCSIFVDLVHRIRQWFRSFCEVDVIVFMENDPTAGL